MGNKMTEEEMLKEIERLKEIEKRQDEWFEKNGQPVMNLETDGAGTIIVDTNDERAMRGWGREQKSTPNIEPQSGMI